MRACEGVRVRNSRERRAGLLPPPGASRIPSEGSRFRNENSRREGSSREGRGGTPTNPIRLRSTTRDPSRGRPSTNHPQAPGASLFDRSSADCGVRPSSRTAELPRTREDSLPSLPYSRVERAPEGIRPWTMGPWEGRAF